MKVFNVDENDWYAGETREEVEAYAQEHADMQGEELGIIELTPEDMETLRFYIDEDEDEEDSITFQERLDELIRMDEKFPCFFATSEY